LEGLSHVLFILSGIIPARMFYMELLYHFRTKNPEYPFSFALIAKMSFFGGRNAFRLNVHLLQFFVDGCRCGGL